MRILWPLVLGAGLLGAPARPAEPVPDRLVVLTFDDSSKSHFTVARPLLKRLGFGATFFVTEGFDFRDNRRDYMTWGEIAQLHKDGFEVGNHTRDHQAVTRNTLRDLAAQVRGINDRCREHGIPIPTSFAYPGNGIDPGALPILSDLGIRFARRGGAPEHPYKDGRGFAYEPGRDHPLLIPSAGDARPHWTLPDFRRAVEQARDGRVAVLQFHGVPDTAHDWVNTSAARFEEYMNFLAANRYKVIALRDLARYVDPAAVPGDPQAVIAERQARLKGAAVRAIGRGKQLLVDDWVVAESSGVTRELGRVTKANGGRPIFTDGWFYGTVLHDGGRFKLWYRKHGLQGFGYAESDDGLAFTKRADVRGINFDGGYSLAVEIDANARDPGHRFKAAYDAPRVAAGLAHSADGITWTPYNGGKPVTGRAADTYNQVLWDPLARTYRLFTRTDFGPPGGAAELRGTRSMTNPDPQARPTDWTLVRSWAFDREGKEEAKRRQVYATTCWIYEGVYFALLSVYEYPGDVREGKATDPRKRHERDVMNFYVATSRDGDSWDLQWVYAGRPLVPRGPDGAFDKDLILPASTVVTHADKHWVYYAGGNERHGSEEVPFERTHAIGLATLPLDRFVALRAGATPGAVVTRPFPLEGANLLVNVEAPAGDVSVEILDETGRPLPDYSGANAATARRLDELRWQPRWKSRADLSGLRGQTIRVRFTLRQASLYAFQVQ